MKLCDTCIYRNNTEYEKPCIVYRDDCEFYEKERGDMTDDLISRQAVIDTLDRMDKVLDEDRTVERYKDLLKECYTVLPPVNPQEPKTGHWIDFERPISKGEWISGAKCDVCGYEIGWMFACEWNYCPNCGCRMVEPQESEV